MASESEKRGRKAGEVCRQPTQEMQAKKIEREESFTVALALQDRQKRMMRAAAELEADAMLWG